MARDGEMCDDFLSDAKIVRDIHFLAPFVVHLDAMFRWIGQISLFQAILIFRSVIKSLEALIIRFGIESFRQRRKKTTRKRDIKCKC